MEELACWYYKGILTGNRQGLTTFFSTSPFKYSKLSGGYEIGQILMADPKCLLSVTTLGGYLRYLRNILQSDEESHHHTGNHERLKSMLDYIAGVSEVKVCHDLAALSW